MDSTKRAAVHRSLRVEGGLQGHEHAGPGHRQRRVDHSRHLRARSVEIGRHLIAIDDELEAAMSVARASAADERENWHYSSPEQKKRWAIKWAAPTAEDQIEFIWVRPVAWSSHRIEAVLANTPLNELAGGKTKGDYVSFPIEQMADWIRYLNDDFQGEYEGGYTLKLLTER